MNKREPNFENLKKVLAREVPERPTLFELFLNEACYSKFSGMESSEDSLMNLKRAVKAFAAAGYDYATAYGSGATCQEGFNFFVKKHAAKASRSMNADVTIIDWETYEAFKWPEPGDYSSDNLDKIKSDLPDGMKLMIMGPGGILENMTELVGYDNLCLMLFDEPELVKEIADNIGKRLLTYYETALQHDTVGLICYNDDWGFNTQTLLSPTDLRKYIFPWCKRIVELAHSYHKPCILHSCGYFADIIDDVIDDMRFDARHSYEDNIMPVELAYEKYGNRIAILGGIDVNYICRETPENITKRCRKMLEQTCERGGYALGTGNSVPEYVPFENYMAMTRVALEI